MVPQWGIRRRRKRGERVNRNEQCEALQTSNATIEVAGWLKVKSFTKPIINTSLFTFHSSLVTHHSSLITANSHYSFLSFQYSFTFVP